MPRQRSRSGVKPATGSAGAASALVPAVALSALPWGRAHADAPLNYLTGYGTRAYPVTTLTWAVLIVSCAVILIITGALVAALMRRRPGPAPALPGQAPVFRSPGAANWIAIGVGISTLVLFATVVWTFVVLAEVTRPPGGTPVVKIEVTGHQWWWEVRYLSNDASREFTTANEIHIPVGQPVSVTLQGVDVIHSFWVPKLTGKTDVIPGQTNRTWLEADRPGIYRGQCTEYCGAQHAHMAFEVVASSPAEFKTWRDQQVKGATSSVPQPVNDDENAFIAKCGICHTVRGTRAGGRLGPDLTHLMSRRLIAAGTVPNTPGALSAWIADPQAIKPDNYMPQLDLSGPQLASIRRFVDTLK